MAAKQRLIPLSARDEWYAALAEVPHAFGHTWESCQAMSLTTGMPTWLYLWEHESGRAVCPLAERRFGGAPDVVTPYGFSGFVGTGDTAAMPDDWTSFAVRKGYVCGYIATNPVLSDLSGFDPADVHRHHELYVLDLTRSEDALFASLSRNRRRHILAAQNRDWLITDHNLNSAFLLRRHREFFEWKRAAGTYRFSDATLRALLASPHTLLIGAGTGGTVQAVWLFTWTRWVGESFMTVSLPGAEHYATALTWHGVLELRKRGVPALNLGGGVRPCDGVARFKQRFGAVALPSSVLKQVYDPAEFRRLCMLSRADPDDRAGYFPPYQRGGAAHAMASPSQPRD